MFAVIQSGGKQYKVQVGDELTVERLSPGKSDVVKLDKVLLYSKQGAVQVGRPYVKGAWCEAEVVAQDKLPRVVSFKYIRREKSATKIGHRQLVSRIKIKSLHRDGSGTVPE